MRKGSKPFLPDEMDLMFQAGIAARMAYERGCCCSAQQSSLPAGPHGMLEWADAGGSEIAEGGCMAMTTLAQTWQEDMIEAAGTTVQLVKGGNGAPLLILHGELGHSGWLRVHEALAQHHTLYIPSHPGFGKSPGLDWVLNIRDMAAWYLDALDDLGLGHVPVVGFSLGAWLAAEMAM